MTRTLMIWLDDQSCTSQPHNRPLEKPGVLVICVVLLYILVVVLIRSKGLHQILSYGITQL